MALKIAKRGRQTARFRREFGLLQKLAHPSVPEALGFGVIQRTPYLVLSLARGVPLFSCRSSAPTFWLHLAVEVLDALAHVHARGVVHGDLNPRNIIVASQTPLSITLLDFGLARRTQKRAKPGGTLPYVAPELLREEAVDGRADLYALGVVLYEGLLAGHLSEDPMVLWQGLQRARMVPRRLDPLVPERLSELVLGLLSPDPEGRFANALAALEFLAEDPTLELVDVLRRCRDRLLVGRGAAYRSATQRLSRLLSPGSAVVLEAPRGLGKSPVLRSLVGFATLKGWNALTQRATPDFSLSAVLERVAARLGSHTPLLVLLDDAHLLGPAALRAALSVGESLAQHGRLVLASDEPLAGVERSSVTRLQPLSVHETRRLADERLFGLKLPWAPAARICRDTAGQPSLVVDTLSRLLAAGSIRALGPGFSFEGGRYQAAETHRDWLSQKLADLTPVHWEVLHATAVLHPHSTVQRVLALAGSEREPSFQALAQRGLLALQDGEIRFASSAMRRAAYEHIEPAALRALHDAAARVLGGEQGLLHQLNGSGDHEAVAAAVLLGQRATASGRFSEARVYFLRAHARSKGDRRGVAVVAQALGALALARGILPEAWAWFAKAQEWRSLGEVAHMLGDVVVTQRCADLLRQQARILDAEWLDGLAASRRGELPKAAAILERLEQDPRLPEPQRIRVMLDSAQVARKQGRSLDALRAARQAARWAQRHDDQDTYLRASTTIAQGCTQAGRYRASRRVLEHALERCADGRNPLREAILLRELGDLQLRGAELAAARDTYQRALSAASVCQSVPEQISCLLQLGIVETHCGGFHRGLRALTSALQRGREAQDAYRGAQVAVALAHLWWQMQQPRRALGVLATLPPTETVDAALGLRARGLELLVRSALSPARDQAAEWDVLDRESADHETRAWTLWCMAETQARPDAAAALCALARAARLRLYEMYGLALSDQSDVALDRACALGFLPLEVRIRSALAPAMSGWVRAEMTTRAMERLAEMVRGLPEHTRQAILCAPLALKARQLFLEDRVRLDST